MTLATVIVTGCAHCQAFTRDVMEPVHAAGKVCVLAVAFDEDGDIGKFSREQKINFPLFKIERKYVREFLGMTGQDRAIGTPQVVVIDRHGMIRGTKRARGNRRCCCSAK